MSDERRCEHCSFWQGGVAVGKPISPTVGRCRMVEEGDMTKYGCELSRTALLITRAAFFCSAFVAAGAK